MDRYLEEIWQKSLQSIKEKVGDNHFHLWFGPLKLLQLKDGQATVEVPNRFFKEWIEDAHPLLVSEALETVTGQPAEVKFRLSPTEDNDIKKIDARLDSRKTKLARRGIFLNPRYTFATFIVGPSNQFAQAAARAVAEAPGRAYNPLYIYGGVGLGKTHLISAVGNHVVDKTAEANVLYVSAEQFTNEVVSALRHQKMEEVKSKYRNLDMLLVDDVQFLSKKEHTQEELFHTLNTLYLNQKQIVLSSDRPPKEIKDVTDRLKSRFGMGLIADIQPPEVELKMAIIQKKASEDKLSLPVEVTEYIAAHVKSNIRDIEGCLIRLGAHSSLTGSPVTLEMAKSLLRDFIHDDERPLTVEAIMKAVAEHFGIKVQELRARKRTREVVLPRQAAMYLSRELTEASLSDIGKNMAKDHATVIYACRQIEERMGKDENFKRMVENLKNKIKP